MTTDTERVELIEQLRLAAKRMEGEPCLNDSGLLFKAADYIEQQFVALAELIEAGKEFAVCDSLDAQKRFKSALDLAAQQRISKACPPVDAVHLIVRSCCESEPADPDSPDTICINVLDLQGIVASNLGALILADDPIPSVRQSPVGAAVERDARIAAARFAFATEAGTFSFDSRLVAFLAYYDAALTAQQQDASPSPMSKMAEALRQKSAAEREDYENRRQAGEWGHMPEAGTEADFCPACSGTGWDGESRTAVCPKCNGGREQIPAAQQQESGS